MIFFLRLALLLFFFFHSSKTNTEIQTIYLSDQMIHVPEKQLNSTLKIIPKENIVLPNYIKIFVKGYNEVNVDLNHIISYYQDESLEDRKQLAQSLYGNTTMWLNKKQIENEFYLTVDCFEEPCNYTIDIIPKDICELPLNEQFTYYVSEDNQEMKFRIKIF